ncbi:MAG TPA: hypothetical protein VM510_05925 [Caulifigura sp.]|nr:hypothetical protein [Caulifigura sp.]
MRRIIFCVLSSALCAGVYLSAEDPAPTARDRTAELMQAKLKAIHQIAEGLVCKDFDRVEESGAALAALSSGSDWEVHSDSVYRDHRDQLQRSALRVAELARVRNLEGATYGYINLISGCVDCHSHCRDVLNIADPMPVLRPVPTSSKRDDDGPVLR